MVVHAEVVSLKFMILPPQHVPPYPAIVVIFFIHVTTT
jgi:hypothetical protein